MTDASAEAVVETGTSAAAVEAGQSAAPAWYADVKDEGLRGIAEKRAFTPETILKSYSELEKQFHSGDKLIIPKDGDKAALDMVYDRLGRPKDPAEYFADHKWDGLEPDPEMVKGFQAKAHELGLNKAQAKALAEWQIGEALKAMPNPEAEAKAFEQAQAQAREVLSKEWGVTADEKLADIDRAVDALGLADDELQKIVAALGPEAAARKFQQIGSKFGKEAPFIGGDRSPGITPEAARQELAEIRKNPAYTNRADTGYKALHERALMLTRILTPEAA